MFKSTIIAKTLLPCIIATGGGTVIGANVPHIKRSIHRVQRHVARITRPRHVDRPAITAPPCDLTGATTPTTTIAWPTISLTTGSTPETLPALNNPTSLRDFMFTPPGQSVLPEPSAPVSPIPEPASWLLWITGFALLAATLRWHIRKIWRTY